MTLDDETIDAGFFSRKTDESKLAGLKKNVQQTQRDFSSSDVLQRFLKLGAELGLSEEKAKKWCEEDLTALDQEPEEDDLFVQHIKNFS